MWRWAGRADREQGEGCDLSGMWQKYKIIDYQRWHLSDLLQQATFHFFANSAASVLSPPSPIDCLFPCPFKLLARIPSLKPLCDIDTLASTLVFSCCLFFIYIISF